MHWDNFHTIFYCIIKNIFQKLNIYVFYYQHLSVFSFFYFLKKQKYIFKIDKQTNILNYRTATAYASAIYIFAF